MPVSKQSSTHFHSQYKSSLDLHVTFKKHWLWWVEGLSTTNDQIQLCKFGYVISLNFEVLCKWDIWCRDRDDTKTLRVSRPRRWSDDIETRQRRSKKRLETILRPRRSRPRLQPWCALLCFSVPFSWKERFWDLSCERGLVWYPGGQKLA